MQPELEQLATPVFWLDQDGVIQGGNSAMARWMEASLRRVIGLSIEQLESDVSRLRDVMARLISIGDAPINVRRIRFQVPLGAEREADIWISRWEGGFIIEAHPSDGLSGQDYEHSLPGALHAALKGLAHEVRNPLAGLKGAAQLLARRSEDNDARRYIEVILHECDRLALLVDRLLNPSQGSVMRSTNVHEALERVRLLADAQVQGAVKLLRDYDPSLPEIHADADRLTQALWNLVRNAMEAGAREITLRTRAEHNTLIGERVCRLALRVDVEDNGSGVSEALSERIFLPLVSGRAEGTGLGLTLSQQVAQEHGGALHFRSRPGQTIFTLWLPVE